MKYINLSHPSKRLPLCLCIEFLMIISSVLLLDIAFGLWHTTEISLSWDQILIKSILISIVCQICLYYTNLYNFRIYRQNHQFFKKISQAIGITTITLTTIFYIIPSLSINHRFLMLNMILVWSVLLAWRPWLQRKYVHQKRRIRVAIIGTDDQARGIANEILENQMLGYDFRGYIGEYDEVVRN